MYTEKTTLDKLRFGEEYEIIELQGSGEIQKRLLDMGFVPGAKGRRLHQGLLRDPIEIELASFKVSLRRSEARRIQVIRLQPSQGAPPHAPDSLATSDYPAPDNGHPAPRQQEEKALNTHPHHGRTRGPHRDGRGPGRGQRRGRWRRFLDPMERWRQGKTPWQQWQHGQSDQGEQSNILRIAVAGNPNTGKSSLYNLITGSQAQVGNYSGVTVDSKRIRFEYKGATFEFIDLPGTYSLSAYSFEEVVSRDFILMQKPDVVLDVMDATNLERNLYLLLQFQELGVPVVGALNMIDEADTLGMDIDHEQLSKLLQIPLVKTSAVKNTGIQPLLDTLLTTAQQTREIQNFQSGCYSRMALTEPKGRHLNYGPALEGAHDELIQAMASDQKFAEHYSLHWTAIKLLEDDMDAKLKVEKEHGDGADILKFAASLRDKLEREFGLDPAILVAQQRYGFIRGALSEAVTLPERKPARNLSERLDRLALHRIGGVFLFFGIMFLIYQLTFTLGDPVSGWIETLFAYLQQWLGQTLPPGLFNDFLTEGIIGGVGGVLVFLPLIILLFAGLSFLEDSGYMARAAFVMDKIMHKFGLHGRSFIPMMISTGCAVPAVMATRTLAGPKDRIITAVVLPMMMCSAKTPVVAMLVGAFFAEYAGLYFWLFWLLTWVISLLAALFLHKTLFQGESTPFVMELPPYRFPTGWGIIKHMWEKAVGYIKKAGTVILAASVLTWIAFNFPQKENFSKDYDSRIEHLQSRIDQAQSPDSGKKAIQEWRQQKEKLVAAKNRETFLYTIGGRLGNWVEPYFSLMGFDYKMSVSLLAALPAKEIVISTMGVVYGIDSQGEGQSLKTALRQDQHYSPLVVFSFIIFLLIYTPCFATLAVIKRELDGWRWVFFAFGFSFVLASALSIGIYQIGSLIMT